MICKNCDNESFKYSKYSSGEFCSRKCSRSYSTKNKRKEINEKVSKTLTGSGNDNVTKICQNCSIEFEIKFNKRNQKFCSSSCNAKNRWGDKDYKNKMINLAKERCKNIEERKRLEVIGRKGGFGKRGETKNRNKYSSLLEKECFEYLEYINFNFFPHKPIPNSSKISDIYLDNYDIWIEIDGINREKGKKWLGKKYDYWLNKIKIYNNQGLDLKIVYDFNEFKELIDNLTKLKN